MLGQKPILAAGFERRSLGPGAPAQFAAERRYEARDGGHKRKHADGNRDRLLSPVTEYGVLRHPDGKDEWQVADAAIGVETLDTVDRGHHGNGPGFGLCAFVEEAPAAEIGADQ